MTEIRSAGYSVFINKDIAAEINRFFESAGSRYSKIFILVDENSMKHCYPQLVEKIEAFKDAELIEIESGEENKTLEVCAQIWKTLSEFGADRKSLFVNLGGGVICDMGGFIASTFKRGISFINIPTTLLSQVDASVGGKTGIDLDHLKNEIGVFSAPSAVFINPDFIHTLDKRQLLSGFAEVIKHGLIADVQYWDLIKQTDALYIDDAEKLIAASVRIKNKIILEDPNEANLRKILNFGHTIGHAIESFFLMNNKTLLHGEAIAVGMICEAYISSKECGLSDVALSEITSYILDSYKAVPIKTTDHAKLIELMKHDKKNENDSIMFSLLSGIGKCEINCKVNNDVILESLKYYSGKTKTVK
ncbi:MAG: aroB [Bacteroidota bacterium]|jgi:3-dehydroquinate synthase|nr:aroB [Bacteroidota bacterium]